MELYIPPPSAFLPRLPPPKPVVPAVPIVPIPDLPSTIYAPEGAYTQNASLFPSIGSPVAPIALEHRPTLAAASFIGGAGGFIVAPAGPVMPGATTGQTAMSFGSTIVNGQTQPAWPVRFSWVSVYFPLKGGDKAGLGRLGMGKSDPNQMTSPPPQQDYEPSISSNSSSPTGSDNPPPPIAFEVPTSALPQQQGKRMPFTKASAPSGLPRPKNNLRSSSSTFVTRLQALDALPKILADKGKLGAETVRWGFWNLGRTFGWAEEGGKIKDTLSRVTFSQVPTCHAVSLHTVSQERVDCVVGFSSGDIVWLDFIVGRYSRINKGGILNNTAVISVNFDPRYPHHFIATFADATILRLNLFAEDPISTAINGNAMPWTIAFDAVVDDEVERIQVWKNEEFGNLGDIKKNAKEERPTWAGRNPMAAWKISKKPLNAVSYSPDASYLALVGEDGKMRLVDVAQEKLTDVFDGYFGALNCVAWSPDSRFIAIGGQDDLITIFSAKESRVVARCQGHSAFVSGITFDYTRGGGYRFGSVGEDGKLILWDFTAAQLHRPRHHHPNTSHHRLALGSTLSLNHNNTTQSTEDGARFHAAPPRHEVAILQPVMARMVEGNLITSVHFTSQAIYTVSRAALVKIWQRPPRQSALVKRSKKGVQRNDVLKSPRERDIAVTA